MKFESGVSASSTVTPDTSVSRRPPSGRDILLVAIRFLPALL